VIGADDRKGKLLPGYDADLVIMDEQHHIVQTMVAGEIRYSK
jgi:N-acetylglucosamine-6-phosphate deacetylase